MAEKDKSKIKSCCSKETFNKKIDSESSEIKVESCCKNNVKKKIESESLEGQEIELLPPLLPAGIGRIMVLQYIRHSSNEDRLNFLLPFGFAIGCVSFAIALHSTGVEYIFNQFGAFFAYIPRRVEKVREVAHRINQTLCILQILMALVMFAYCLHWESDVTNEVSDKEKDNYVQKNVWMLSFVFSGVCFGCTIVAVIAAISIGILYKLKVKLASTAKEEDSNPVPPTAEPIIDPALSYTLIDLYIGIDLNSVERDQKDLLTLCMWVGMITFMMLALDNILSVSLYIISKQNRLVIDEVLFQKIIHYLRYVMVLVQLLSAFSILGLGVNIWRLEGGKDNNLIETSVTLSCFVVAGAAVVLTVTIFLVCKGKDVKHKANVVIVKGKAVRMY